MMDEIWVDFIAHDLESYRKTIEPLVICEYSRLFIFYKDLMMEIQVEVWAEGV
jgi:hypothetical protein